MVIRHQHTLLLLNLLLSYILTAAIIIILTYNITS